MPKASPPPVQSPKVHIGFRLAADVLRGALTRGRL
jgi:hypothetical protein